MYTAEVVIYNQTELGAGVAREGGRGDWLNNFVLTAFVKTS